MKPGAKQAPSRLKSLLDSRIGRSLISRPCLQSMRQSENRLACGVHHFWQISREFESCMHRVLLEMSTAFYRTVRGGKLCTHEVCHLLLGPVYPSQVTLANGYPVIPPSLFVQISRCKRCAILRPAALRLVPQSARRR